MGKKRKHGKAEIAALVAQADDLAMQGKLQSEIARTLGISVMTLHRWRKAAPEPGQAMNGSRRGDQTPQIRIAELQLENSRLRQLVTDLLLKKIELEETLQGGHRNAVLTGIRASQIDFLKEAGSRAGCAERYGRNIEQNDWQP